MARRVASTTRKLDPSSALLVDRAAAAAVDEGPGRLLSIAEAKTMEADLEAARVEREEALRRRHVAITRTSDDGLRTVVAPVAPADGVFLDATPERVADALDARRDLVEELATVLGHSRITLAPVIDLNHEASVNGYEHPDRVK